MLEDTLSPDLTHDISPCPFCYSRRMHMASALFTHKVVCEQCRCSGPQKRCAADAVRDWNQLSQRVWNEPTTHAGRTTLSGASPAGASQAGVVPAVLTAH